MMQRTFLCFFCYLLPDLDAGYIAELIDPEQSPFMTSAGSNPKVGPDGTNTNNNAVCSASIPILRCPSSQTTGFSTAAESVSANDPLQLINCRITNAVKCLPPDNKPIGAEINTCNDFLANELRSLTQDSVVLALGGIAHRAVIKSVGGRQSAYKFGHAAEHKIEDRFTMLDSYHCSRYNTNTRRLTPEMFQNVFARARDLLNQ